MISWVLILPDETALGIIIPDFIKTSNLRTDLLYFLAYTGVWTKSGKLFKNHNMFLFVFDPGASDVEITMKHHVLDTFRIPSGLERVIINEELKQEMFKLLNDTMNWGWFAQKLNVMGPVSCFAAISSKNQFEILLFGDIHDNLNVTEKFTSKQVQENFQKFFGASKSFYDEPQQFSQFKFIVEQMKLQLYTTKETQWDLFIWEFLVCILHIFNTTNTCLDIIVEDPLDMPYEPQLPNHFLDAVRYLFSICPMVSIPDSPFASFVPHCKELFPALRYHRIDLRYNVYEDVKGNFENDDFTGLKMFLFHATSDSPPSFQSLLGDLYAYHKMDDTKDMAILNTELHRMYTQFFESKLYDKIRMFLKVFETASTRYWNHEHGRGKWFFLRTCITDVYGLSRLYRNEIPLKTKPLSRKKKETRICASSSYAPRKVICYIGDYHAQVWRKVILELDRDIFISHDNVAHKGHRVMEFKAFTRKPLTSMQWNEPRDMFEKFITPLDTESLIFVNELDKDSMRKFFVFYLAKNLPQYRYLEKDFAKALKQAKTLLDERIIKFTNCGNSDSDAFGNDFADMDYDEIKEIYKKPNTIDICYPASFMYDLWKSQYKAQRAFRDPRTRQAILESEKEMILEFVQQDTPTRIFSDVKFIIRVKKQTKHQYKFDVIVFGLGDFFLTLVYAPLKEIPEIQRALQEVLEHANVKYVMLNKEEKTGVIDHESIHFNNFRTEARWLDHEQALKDFKEELQPFIEWDWKNDEEEEEGSRSPVI